MNDLFDLRGDVAVVIGGTGVLGGAMAAGLASAGARVAILGRNPERGSIRAREITDGGGEAAFYQVDATNRADLETAARAIESQLGAPTVLLNAAGGNDPKLSLIHI